MKIGGLGGVIQFILQLPREDCRGLEGLVQFILQLPWECIVVQGISKIGFP